MSCAGNFFFTLSLSVKKKTTCETHWSVSCSPFWGCSNRAVGSLQLNLSSRVPDIKVINNSIINKMCLCVSVPQWLMTMNMNLRFLPPYRTLVCCRAGVGGNQWLSGGNVLTVSDCSSFYSNLSGFLLCPFVSMIFVQCNQVYQHQNEQTVKKL